MSQSEVVRESLEKVIEHLEEEARMELPGIQALFGFQLIAVFNQRFVELSAFAQNCHFAAILSSAIAVLLVLTPAAYHRQAEPRQISDRLCRLGSIFLTLSMLPLAAGISLDVLVITELMKFSTFAAYGFATLTFALFFIAWFVFPRLARRFIHDS